MAMGQPRFCLVLTVILLFGYSASAQDDVKRQPKVSADPFTAEQLTVYRAALSGWFGQEAIQLNLAAITDPASEGDFGYDKSCVAKASSASPLDSANPSVSHRFRPQDVSALGPGTIRLVEPDDGARDVKANDPGNAIREGKAVDAAVSNGFRHALFTFSDIRFNKAHSVAVLSFHLWCGALCGNGSTVILAKQKDGTWKQIKVCGGFVS